MSLTKVTYSMIQGAALNVLDYGAVGDGITNDTAAIQAAINAAEAGNGSVYLPVGNYLVNDLTISSARGVEIVGERQPAYTVSGQNNGTRLTYAGSGYAINIEESSSGFIYRVNIRNLGIWFTQAAQGGVYGLKVQESSFENIGINGDDAYIVSYGFDFDGLSITNIDDCEIQKVAIAINTRFGASSASVGGVNITRNNIFDTTTAIRFGLVNSINIENNWIEGFQNAFLLDNSSPNQRTEIYSANICNNVLLQSTAGLTQTRAINVGSLDNSKPIRVQLNVNGNQINMASGSATKPDYAIDFNTSTNASIVEILAKIQDNWFLSVNNSGIYVDSAKPIVIENGNVSRDAFYGTLLPNVTTSYSKLSNVYTLYQKGIGSSAPANTSENTLFTFTVPANTLGKNGMLRVTTEWTCTNNANIKTVRMRFGAGGVVAMERVLTSASLAVVQSKLSNRNGAASQVTYSTANLDSSTSSEFRTSTADTAIDQTFVITGQKVTAGDTLTVETILVEIIPS